EICNGADDDCDSATDEPGAGGCSPWLRDTDGDEWGVALDVQCLCAPTGAYRAAPAQGGDCDDLEIAVNPGVEEGCDGVDNDCNGVADDPATDGCGALYQDRDGDTFGVTDDVQCLCGPIGTYTATRGGDCDDIRGFVNPDA